MNSQQEEEQPLSREEDFSGSQLAYNQNNEDERLRYAMITLNVDELIHLFTENNITFVDLLLLSKEDLSELRLSLYQRNRIWNFSQKFNAYAKNYSMSELTDFFLFNKQFIFNPSILERITANNQGFLQNNNNNNYQLTGSFNLNNNHSNNINEGISSNNKNNITNIPYENENAMVRDSSNFNNEGIINKEDNINVHNVSKKENTKQKEKFKEHVQNDESNNNNLMLNINQTEKTKYKQEKPFKKNSNPNSNKNINKQNNNNNNIKGSTTSPEHEAQIPKKNKNKNLNSNTAYKKYIETKKEADKILEQLSKLKEDQESKHHKYQILMKRSFKGSSSGFGLTGTYSNSNYNNYEERNEQEYIGEEEEENELQNEYDKMASKIEEIEKMKMDYNTFMLLNKIKNQVINKGDNITFEDINAVNEKLIALEEVINKKEMLRQNLQNKKESIEKTKNLLNNIDNGCNNNMNVNYNCNEYNCQGDVNDVNEVEEVQEEYEQESEDQINYKENSM